MKQRWQSKELLNSLNAVSSTWTPLLIGRKNILQDAETSEYSSAVNRILSPILNSACTSIEALTEAEDHFRISGALVSKLWVDTDTALESMKVECKWEPQPGLLSIRLALPAVGSIPTESSTQAARGVCSTSSETTGG